jgi:hypothetical protein
VYWFRRALVFGTVFGLIFVFAHLVTGSGGDPSATAAKTAAKTTARTTPSPTPQSPIGPVPGRTAAANPTASVSTAQLPAPDGPCTLDEVTVTPSVGTAPAGSAVALSLQLTGIRPACTFAVSSKSVVVKVTTTDKIWSSQDCPTSIPTSSVVVRSGTPTAVQVRWSGRLSDPTCSRAAAWALPGTYHVIAAAIGSEPTEADVKLTTPPRPIITKTVQPKPKKKQTMAITPNTGRRSH